MGLTWGLPNVDSWAIDSITPLGPLSYGYQLLHTGHWWTKYPPFHFTLLGALYAPYVVFLVLTGALDLAAAGSHYPYGLAMPELSLTIFTLIGRVLSACMGIGTVVSAYLIGRELAGSRAGLFAGLLFAACPLTVYYSHTGNLDIPYMFWSALALLCLVRVVRGAGHSMYVRLGVFAAVAAATKDQAYGLFILLPLPLLAIHWRQSGSRALVDSRLLAGLGAALLTYLVAANVVVDFPGWLKHLRHITGEGSVPYRMFPATAAGYLGLAGRTLHFTVQALTGPALALAVGGLVLAHTRRIRGAGMLLVAAGAYLVLVPGVVLYVLPRFVLPIVFVLSVLAGLAAAVLWETRLLVARVVVVVVIAYAAARGASTDLGLLWDSRYAAEEWMMQNMPAGVTVGTTGEPVYLPRFPRAVTKVAVTVTTDGPVAEAELPEYLVLSDAYYKRYLRRREFRPAMKQLLSGKLDYEPVAVFRREGLPVTELIPTLNPRIVILRRRVGTDRASSGKAWRLR